MAAVSCAFWLPRRGNRPEEYADAFAADPAAGRFAVADGAAQSGFADLWARLLVDDFVRQPHRDLQHWTDRLPDLQGQWHAIIGSQPIPWYAKAKFEQGACATFLGLTLAATAEGGVEWRAVAVGDTCSFHTRSHCLLSAFPLHHSGQFNNYPELVGARAAPESVRQTLSRHACGTLQVNDRLWLTTDALAQWCLSQHEASGNPWAEMESLVTGPETAHRFAFWIDELRDSRHLRNDDVTLLAVTLIDRQKSNVV